MKKYIIIILVTVFSNNIQGQILEDICSVEGSPTLKSAPLLGFNDISNEPIKYVRVNLIFLRKTDGSGGFQENDPDHQTYINDKINNSNNFMASIPPNYDTNCYNGSAGTLNDSKIRFVFNVMYVDNTTYWNNHTSSGYCQNLPSNLIPLNNSIIQSSAHPAINVFYTEDDVPYNNIVVNQNCPINPGIPSTSCTWYPSFSNFSYNQTIHMRNNFTRYYWGMNCVVGNSNWGSPSEETVYTWLHAGRLEAHELAHNLNLIDIHKPNGDCAEHLMMHNADGYGNFLSPVEIASMHQALTFSSARKYVLEDTYGSIPLQVNQNTTWADNIRIYRGLTIQNGAQFQLENELIIPSQVDILVRGSSSLALSSATIHTASNSSKLDLNVSENSTVTLTNSTIENCNISIQSGSFTLNNSIIDLNSSGCFSVDLGSTLTFNSGTIQ